MEAGDFNGSGTNKLQMSNLTEKELDRKKYATRLSKENDLIRRQMKRHPHMFHADDKSKSERGRVKQTLEKQLRHRSPKGKNRVGNSSTAKGRCVFCHSTLVNSIFRHKTCPKMDIQESGQTADGKS